MNLKNPGKKFPLNILQWQYVPLVTINEIIWMSKQTFHWFPLIFHNNLLHEIDECKASNARDMQMREALANTHVVIKLHITNMLEYRRSNYVTSLLKTNLFQGGSLLIFMLPIKTNRTVIKSTGNLSLTRNQILQCRYCLHKLLSRSCFQFLLFY